MSKQQQMARPLFGPSGVGRAVVMAVAALLLGWWTVRDALVEALARQRPNVALRLDPTDAVALATDFRLKIANHPPSPAALHDWAMRARTSLAGAPLSASMVRMVASDPATPQSKQLLQLAERISRRDALLQIALIEAAVFAGRIDLALTHYDRALSIYPDTRPLLFPVLASAIEQPAVRAGLIDVTHRRRPWIGAFLAYAVQQAPSAHAVADLLTRLDHGSNAYPGVKGEEAALAVRLLASHDYRTAHALAQRSIGSDAAAIDRPGFSTATWATATRPLTWTTVEAESIDTQPDGSTVTVTAGPGSSGLAFYRVLIPPPGRYRFAATAAPSQDGISMAAGSWNLICLGVSGQPTQLGTVRTNPAGAATVNLPVTVDSGCGAVRIGFTIDNIDGSGESSIVLRDLAFAPLR